jgi:hypothetical protein
MSIEASIRRLDIGALRTTYGDRLPLVLNWVQALAPHEGAFAGVTLYGSRENVIHVFCPMPAFNVGGVVAAIDVRVPPLFPEGAIMPRVVRADNRLPFSRGTLGRHQAMDSEGLVRLRSLPEFSTPAAEKAATLVDVLMAMCVVLSQVAPSSASTVGAGAPPPLRPGTEAAVPAASPPLGSYQAAVPALFIAAADVHVAGVVEEARRAVETQQNLTATHDTLQRLQHSLAEKNRSLQEAQQEVQHMTLLCTRVAESRPTSALACVEPNDVLSAQGFDLLAEVEACDDALAAMEKRLKRGGYSSTQAYLRAVSEVARQQFECKFLLRKALAKRGAPTTLQ